MSAKERRIPLPESRTVRRLFIVLIVIALLLAGVFLYVHSLAPRPIASAFLSAGHVYAPVKPVQPSGPLNLNAATQAELEALPGIGEKTALRIISARDAAGGFRYPEELLQVKGVGPVLLKSLWPLIRLSVE